MTKALERLGLKELEGIVARGLPAFVEVGNALREIRDRDLYREAGFERWEDYCRERWALSRIHAHRTIEAARVAGMLPTGNTHERLSEWLIRPLTHSGLSDEAKLAAWGEAVELAKQENEPVQEKHVRFAVEHLHEKRTPALPSGKWRVIYADPPWRYDFSRSPSRDIENQYPTMPSEAIAALPVSEVAAKDAVLFLWVPSPQLPHGLDVLAGWGFDYKTCMVWVKDRIGMGYYARQQHELLLIGARGQPGLPPTDVRPPSVILAERTNHSSKPAEVYGLIEAMYPEAKRLELFAREKRRGWDAWGDDERIRN